MRSTFEPALTPFEDFEDFSEGEEVMSFPAVMVAMVGPDHSGEKGSHPSRFVSITVPGMSGSERTCCGSIPAQCRPGRNRVDTARSVEAQASLETRPSWVPENSG